MNNLNQLPTDWHDSPGNKAANVCPDSVLPALSESVTESIIGSLFPIPASFAAKMAARRECIKNCLGQPSTPAGQCRYLFFVGTFKIIECCWNIGSSTRGLIEVVLLVGLSGAQNVAWCERVYSSAASRYSCCNQINLLRGGSCHSPAWRCL